MPNIKGTDLTDGIKILSGELIIPDAHYTLADLIKYLSTHTFAQTEASVSRELSNLTNKQVEVHIYSDDPLKYNVCVADLNITIPDNWWE